MLQNNWQKPAGKGLDEVFKWSPLLIKVISGPFNSSPVPYIRSLVKKTGAGAMSCVLTNVSTNPFVITNLYINLVLFVMFVWNAGCRFSLPRELSRKIPYTGKSPTGISKILLKFENNSKIRLRFKNNSKILLNGSPDSTTTLYLYWRSSEEAAENLIFGRICPSFIEGQLEKRISLCCCANWATHFRGTWCWW